MMNNAITRVVKMSSLAAALMMVSVFASQMAHAGLVKIDGSSTVFPVTEAVAEDFQKSVKGKTKVTVGISGTGGGFKKFCRGELDIADASRPILTKEMEECAKNGVKYIELPVALDALTVVVNKSNNFVDYLTVAELKKMWEPSAQGKITNWNQIRASFPDLPLKLAGAGSDSGTFDYFTEAIVGKAKSSRGDYLASEDDNVVVQFVSRDKAAIGYFGLAYYTENANKLKAVAIKMDDKSPGVLPSVQNANNGSYVPLSRPIFIYVSAKSVDNPEVKSFVEYYLKHGGKLSKEVGYVDLPKKAYDQAMGNFQKRKLGTGFGGVSDTSVTVEELLAREGKL